MKKYLFLLLLLGCSFFLSNCSTKKGVIKGENNDVGPVILKYRYISKIRDTIDFIELADGRIVKKDVHVSSMKTAIG